MVVALTDRFCGRQIASTRASAFDRLLAECIVVQPMSMRASLMNASGGEISMNLTFGGYQMLDCLCDYSTSSPKTRICRWSD
jgi:hypothetical protein